MHRRAILLLVALYGCEDADPSAVASSSGGQMPSSTSTSTSSSGGSGGTSAGSGGSNDVYPGASWETSTPADEGLDPTAFQQALDTLPAPAVVIRHGKIVGSHGDIALPGYAWSGSKSLTALIAGRLIQEGVIDYGTVVPGSDFPSAPPATYGQFMAMVSDFGLDPHNPGDHYAYNNGAVTHYCDSMLSEFYPGEDHAQMLVSAFLSTIGSEDPIGFAPYCSGWGGGWSISTRDMARIGYLVLRNGSWNDTQLLPASFVDALYVDQIPSSTSFSPDSDDGYYNEFPDSMNMADGYSYGFWLPQHSTLFGGSTSQGEWTSMAGAFGTSVHISRASDLVVAAVNTSADHAAGKIAASSLDLLEQAIIAP